MATSDAGGFLFGTKDVASAGTAVQLDATGYTLKALTIIAHADNAGKVFYGGSDVDSSTQKGLAASESITLTAQRTFDLADMYIDAANANDGVDFVAVKAV